MFLYKKIVDQSTLRQGFQIPTQFRPLLKEMPRFGESWDIKILLDGYEYDAKLKNQRFDEKKYDHAEVLQIRYSPTSPLAKILQSIFVSTFDFVTSYKQSDQYSKKKKINLPEENQEYLVLYTTDFPNVFRAETFTISENLETRESYKSIDELFFETFEPKEDKNASIKTVNRMQKVRVLDRSIGDALKQLYGYRCQMTNEQIGKEYGASVVEAHHLIPFTQSLNNDTSNIIIISPNYHRIIHTAKPTWNSQELSFTFPNGLKEKIKLNLHLK